MVLRLFSTRCPLRPSAQHTPTTLFAQRSTAAAAHHQWPRHVAHKAAAAGGSDTAASTSGREDNNNTTTATAATQELPKQRLLYQKLQSNFCKMCGGGMDIVQPEGDKEWRHVCSSCGYIDYFNPKMVVGCVVEHENKILLCRRGIEPCKGLWSLPAGFMELGESTADGAARETLEEANAAVRILGPFAHWDIPVIGQAYILFRAELAAPYTFSAGAESLEVALFEPENIPFDEIAFSSISITLRHYVKDMADGSMHFHHGVIHRKPEAAPNDPSAFELRDHFALAVGGGGGGGK